MRALAVALDTALSDLTGRWAVGILVVVLALFPLLGEGVQYTTVLLMTVFLFATLGHAWNLLAGFCGLLSFGTQVYVGLSGFSVAIAVYYLGVPVWVGAILGAVVAALFAWLQAMPISDRNSRRNTIVGVAVAVVLWIAYEIVIAYEPGADVFGSDYIRRVVILFCIFIGALPLLKLQGAYFAVATWLIAAAVASIFNEWRLVGAGGGMTIPSGTSIAGRYYAGLAIVALSTLVVWRLLGSRYGAALTAVRDDEEAAAAVGIDIRRIKTMVFVISAPMAGLAAAVYYIDTVTITPPDAFHIRWSAYVVFIVVAGGMGTLWGPIVGAVLFVIVQRFIVGVWGGGELTLGIVAVLLILVLPRGAMGAIDDARRWAARRRRAGGEPVGGAARRPDALATAAHADGRGRAVASPPAVAGVAVAALLPQSPLPALRPANPPWAGLADAAERLGEHLRAAGVETVVVSSAGWRVSGETPVHLRRHIAGRLSDPRFAALGDLPYDIGVDDALARAIVDAATASGIAAGGREATGLPVDAGTAAAAHLLDRSGGMRFVLTGIDSRHGFAEAVRFGAAIEVAAERLGRRVAVVGVGTLSAGTHPPAMAPHADGIASAEDDALNRAILGALVRGDAGPLAAPRAGSRALDLAFVGVAVGALGPRWRSAEVIAYGATWGAGAAVVRLDANRRS